MNFEEELVGWISDIPDRIERLERTIAKLAYIIALSSSNPKAIEEAKKLLEEVEDGRA